MELAKFSDYLIPVLLAGAALYALCRRVDVFSALTTGAGEGLSVCCGYCRRWWRC